MKFDVNICDKEEATKFVQLIAAKKDQAGLQMPLSPHFRFFLKLSLFPT